MNAANPDPLAEALAGNPDSVLQLYERALAKIASMTTREEDMWRMVRQLQENHRLLMEDYKTLDLRASKLEARCEEIKRTRSH